MRAIRFPNTAGGNGNGSFRAAWKTMARSLAKLAVRLTVTAPALFAMSAGTAADQTASYPRMAPISAYLMDRGQEIALARSAAPESISKDATILVLTRSGYKTAVTGSNGFVCMVSRSFSGAPDWPERWNPKIRAAECQNPQAARSIAPLAKLRTAMTLAGRTDAEIMARIKAALRTKEIPPLAPGAMSYMMSKSSYLSEDGDHDMPHVMFFIPFKDGNNWGANAAGSPIFGGNYWFATPDHAAETATLPPLSVLLLGACTWSDGTPAPTHQM
jgi:hypothetical protein